LRAERFQQVDELFAAALDTGLAERAALLDAACAGDAELRAEVESLLAAHESAGNFIETTALEAAARARARQFSAETGRRVGHYQILSPLGAGGMGEVYLALDTKLGRRVALKVLPSEFTQDAARVRRFEQEARAASALNHPNIVTVYDIGNSDDRHFIATEFVEGLTLQRIIIEARPEIGTTLDIAAQVAEGLSAAHAEGIVHRDIKPDNIMLRTDGYVKVLDFGIAKLTEPGSSGEDGQTQTGTVVGTVAYMSPEQALGQKVDHRTDIFSLGVIIYELVTGKHPFRGDTNAATFDAILNRDPPPIALDAEAGHELWRVILRALEKDRELRYQTASDLHSELKRLRRRLDAASSASGEYTIASQVGRGFRRRATVFALSLLLIGAIASSVYLALRSRARPAGEVAVARNLNFTQLTDQPGQELYPSLSPDGKVLIYAGSSSGDWDIYWQRVEGRKPRNLTDDSESDDTQPAFSPDGEHIAFRSERDKGGIFIMGATGESARRLTDFGYFPAWSPDGREVAVSTIMYHDPNVRTLRQSAVWVVNVATGEKRQLTDERTGDAAQPQWSPSGARIAYWGRHKGGQRDLWTIPARGGDPVQVTDDEAFDWNPVWSPDGRYVYFASDRGGQMNLWRIPIDEQTGRVTGASEPLTAPSTYAQHVAFSRDGRRAAYVNQVRSTNIYTVPFSPYKEEFTGSPAAVTQGFRHAAAPDLSPDGEWFVYSSQGEKQEDIYLCRRDGSEAPRKLTDDAYKDRNPRWSPDGTRISFYSDRSGKYEAWVINPDGGGRRQITFEGGNVAYPFWSPDGARLAYNLNSESCVIIDAATPWGEQTPRHLGRPADQRLGIFWGFSWSPDGRRLAGWTGQQNDSPGIVIYNFGTGDFERVAEFGSYPIWLKDSRRLLFSHQERLYLVNVEARKVRELSLSLPPSSRLDGFGLSSDNRLLYYGLASKESDIWLLNIE
jgi:Tol biopolymer transport system component/predicted Ser/Thr protein kinase